MTGERKGFKHSWLYYRNLCFQIAAFIFATAALLFGLRRPIDFVWAVPLLLIFWQFRMIFSSVHPRRAAMLMFAAPALSKLAREAVSFDSRDGLRLTGWYVPGQNRAAIILVHGLGGAGIGLIELAEVLAKADYGVLMIDLRAHGGSQGDTCTTGVLEANDVLGAVDYLRTRDDVDPMRIGALGISLGAGAVLRAAAQCDGIRAIVLDGLGPSNLDDHGGRPTTLRRWINYPINWAVYRLWDYLMDVRVHEGMLPLIGRIAPRPLLLITTGKGLEQHIGRLFYQAAAEPKELWEIPGARHAAAYRESPRDYRQKIIGVFDAALK